MVGGKMDRKALKRKHLLQLMAVLVGLTLVTFLSGLKFFRVDLTSEKRYSLSQSSRQIMESLGDVVYIRIYLDGELPPEFVNFRKSIQELMNDFRAYAGENLQYEFINLYDEQDEALRNRMIEELYNKGLRVTNIQIRDGSGGTATRLVIPGAVVGFRGYELPVNLLKNNPSLSHEVNLNNSIQTLEYEFARAIYSLTLDEVPRIAFIEGHGELDSLQTHSLMDELKNFFQIDRGFINGNIEALLPYEALIIARPTRIFSEADKFAIDQYIMQGGKVLFFLDPVNPFADSLSAGTTVALANQVGLEDLLFRYGVRINYNLVADMQCNLVPVNTAPAGEQARFTMMPWVYHPLLSGPVLHPVTRGLNYVKGEFVSSLDTLGESPFEMNRSVLLASSSASRERDVPLYISMEEIMVQPDPALYTASHIPVAILLEGEFESFYKNYPVPAGVSLGNINRLESSRHTSIFVAADGDIAANEVKFEGGGFRAQPLGYDSYTRQTFGNREFILNVVNFMTDRAGIMELRSREFRLRLLNRELTGQGSGSMKWKLINMLLPLLILLLSGVVYQWIRKRRYAR
jgi:gliding-associated putative ABC transporter substrate-binding component GldG